MKRWVLLIVLVSACGDDGAQVEVDATDAVADTADAGDTTAAVDETSAPTTYPDVVYGELLPVAPDFDEDYVGVGDKVVSTLVEVLRPRYGLVRYQDESGALHVPVEDMGRLEAQPGEPHRLRDQLAIDPVSWTPGSLPSGSRSIFFGLVLADPQLVDQDSPAQVAKNAAQQIAGISLPAYTPQGELAVHVDDALFRTADRFQDARPFDVVVVAGDHIENSQRNELRQLHTLLNGGPVSSDSGVADDPVPGPDNDAFDPFIAGGFRAGTPWISTIGNHDVNIEGNFPLGLVTAINADANIRAELDTLAAPLGVTFPFEPTADMHPAFFPDAERSAFRVDPDDFNPAMMTSDAELVALAPGPTPPDAERAPMGVCGFIHATYTAAGAPPGHGYTAANDADCTGFYTYDIPGVPVRIIGLDLGPHEGGSNGILAVPYGADASHAGDPTYDQVAFLRAALADCEADGVGAIVISHQASGEIVTQSQLQDLSFFFDGYPDLRALIDTWSPVPPDTINSAEFRALLASSPALIAHVAGHTHFNRIRAICPDGSALEEGEARCTAGANGETGYWEIVTSSGIDFPHQGRFMEIVQVSETVGALYLTMVEPRIPAGSFSERARFVAVVHEETKGSFAGLGAIGDRNVLLPFRLAPSVAESFSEHVAAPAIASETSLKAQLPALPQLPVWP